MQKAEYLIDLFTALSRNYDTASLQKQLTGFSHLSVKNFPS